MSRPILSEWRGEELFYLSPRESLAKFGYGGPGNRADLTEAERDAFACIEARVPMQDGAVAPEVTPFPSAVDATETVKSQGLTLGADLVGVTQVNPYYVYQGRDLRHRYAIVIAIAMSLEEILQVPRPESNIEYLRVYDAVSRVAVELAAFIRGRGYPARAHTLRDEQLAMLPHAYAAGLGELGKHGSLINRELGCSFRLGIVTTDLPLSIDQPCHDGIEDFCTKCRLCETYCPGDAISAEKADIRGVVKWVVDTEKCAPYFSTYYACAICLRVCPWNAKAFGGVYRSDVIRSVKGLDADQLCIELRAGLPHADTN